MRARAAGALLAVLLLGAAGCGEEDASDHAADEARAVTSQEIRALEDGDFAEACRLLTEHSRKGFVRATRFPTCERGYERLALAEPTVKQFLDETLPEYDLGDARLTDRGAAVTLNGPSGERATTFLIREGGEWRISVLFSQPATAAESQAPGDATSPPGG